MCKRVSTTPQYWDVVETDFLGDLKSSEKRTPKKQVSNTRAEKRDYLGKQQRFMRAAKIHSGIFRTVIRPPKASLE